MSRKGNCWDNSVIFLNLKMERVWQRQYANHDEARHDITQYIVGFYPVRLHSTLGYLSPAAYEAKSTVKKTYLPVRNNLTHDTQDAGLVRAAQYEV
jgi:putative transposase